MKGEVASQLDIGKIDYDAVFAKMKSVGFNGPILVEGLKIGAAAEEMAVNARADREFLQLSRLRSETTLVVSNVSYLRATFHSSARNCERGGVPNVAGLLPKAGVGSIHAPRNRLATHKQ